MGNKPLTVIAIKNLKPKDKEYNVPVPQGPGFCIRVKPSGVKSLTGAPWCSVNGFTSYDKTKKQLDKLLPADMPHWVWHDLRRSAATGMAKLGVAPQIVDLCLNHKSGVIRGIAATYNRFSYAPEMKDAFERWSKHLDTLLYGEAESNVIGFRR